MKVLNYRVMNGYELSRNWFDYCFSNPDKVKPVHSAIYFFAIEHCNRLGWKEKFGFPSQMVMEAIGIKNWRTYSKALSEIVDFGFIDMIEISKNQYSSNIIAIVKNTKAHTKALDKALSKHSTKHSTKQGQSTVSIDKLYNKETIKLLNNKHKIINDNLKNWIDDYYSKQFSFKKSLCDYGFEKDLVDDWIKVRKTKRATNTKTAFDGFIKEVEKRSGFVLNDLLRFIIERNWSGFKWAWIDEEVKKEKNSAKKEKSRVQDMMEQIEREKEIIKNMKFEDEI